jgi:hypothetical protein
LLDPQPDERRRGPLERFEKIALIGFAVAALLQAILGVYRGGSYVGPLLVAIGILLCGGLWLLRARKLFGGVLAVPVGLFLATMGVYSAYTASNVPFISFLGRYSVPLLLIFTGALLLFAEQDWQFQIVPFGLAAIAFVVAQAVLTIESRSDGQSAAAPQKTAGSVIGELQLIPVTRVFVDSINARDATAKIAVTRWIVEDNTVVGFGTAFGKPAVMRAEFRGGKIVEWQVYTDDGGSE